MTRTTTFTRLAALLACGSFFLACSDDPPAIAGDEPAADDGASADEGGSTEEEGNGDGGGSIGIPAELPETLYVSGEAHIEMTGDHEATADFNAGSGQSVNGVVFLTFANVDTAIGGLTISISGDELQTGMALTIGEVTTGGDFAELCDLELTELSEAAVAGSFRCEGIDAASVDGILTVTVEGRFSAVSA